MRLVGFFRVSFLGLVALSLGRDELDMRRLWLVLERRVETLLVYVIVGAHQPVVSLVQNNLIVVGWKRLFVDGGGDSRLVVTQWLRFDRVY